MGAKVYLGRLQLFGSYGYLCWRWHGRVLLAVPVRWPLTAVPAILAGGAAIMALAGVAFSTSPYRGSAYLVLRWQLQDCSSYASEGPLRRPFGGVFIVYSTDTCRVRVPSTLTERSTRNARTVFREAPSANCVGVSTLRAVRGIPRVPLALMLSLELRDRAGLAPVQIRKCGLRQRSRC
jgi:hypothetical protein